MNSLIQLIRNLGPSRLAVVAAVAVAILGLGLYAIVRFNGNDWGLLYSNLDLQDSGKIDQRLTQLNIPHTISNDGTQIFVEKADISKARVSLATDGLPSGGSVGYEIFDKAQGLATSSFVQNINQLRALEGELSRTISGIEGVSGARVHLVLPERELFTREKQQPSASILVRMSGARRLTQEQVAAIAHIVATAVPALKPERVSIADERGTLLAKGQGDGVGGLAGREEAENQRIAYQERLARSVEQLLERSLGPGKVRAEVNATVDYNRVTESQELYNPDQQVVRSTQTVTDNSEQNDSNGDETVTIANNLPQNQGQAATTGGGGSSSRSAHNEETTNYEISKVVRSQVREPGAISKLAIAVLVDGSYTTNQDGTKTYVPRSKEELDQINGLVKSAIGYDAARGDLVDVVNLPFTNEQDALLAKDQLFGIERQDLLKVAEAIVLGIVAILVLFLVVRPLLGQLFESAPQAANAAGANAALLGGPGLGGAGGGLPAFAGVNGEIEEMRQLMAPSGGRMAQLTGPSGALVGVGGDAASVDLVDDMIDLTRIDGRVKASSLRRIGDLVERNPDEVVQVLRTWLFQDGATVG
ncbi:MAG: flagellar basal-body MS-ring/collar protein FliF [Candidatus Symbiobacter sp.]|nr:flagellar basal-body MS-ring/collar protein FliF [Candidatus Symbiobacter sp.]